MHNIDDIIKKLNLGYQPSSQQKTALDFAVNGSGNAILEAVAGSGKTTTLTILISSIKMVQPEDKVLYLVFNKKNQEEAAQKIPQSLADVKTLHSAGFSAFSYSLKGTKMTTSQWDKRKAIEQKLNIPFNLAGFVFDLLSYAKAYGLGALEPVTSERLEDLVDHFSMETQLAQINGENINLYDLVNQGIDLTKQALEISNQLAFTGLIDFDDMLYMPIKANCRMKQYQWVLLDEAQDTSPIRRAIAKKSLSAGGRFIAVGDRHQAIYGFTGADNDSLDLIKNDLNCQELPLTVSYRCPKNIVSFAQQWVKHISAAPNAIDGEIIRGTLEEFKENKFNVQPEDVGLCRNVSPLVELAFPYLAKGIPCRILGKDIAKGLIKLVTKWKKVKTLEQLADRLDSYRAEQTQALLAKGKEVAAGNLDDQVECLLYLIDNMPGSASIKDLEDKINGMFQDDTGSKPVFTFSTIHKSKGLEFNRVFWLQRDKFQPSKYARQAWQYQQEINLMYVAATRAKQTLVDIY